MLNSERSSVSNKSNVLFLQARIQIITGTAAATFPTSSSVCIIFLIRAFKSKKERLDYAPK